MDEKPKSIWKKSFTGWRGLLLGWMALMATLASMGILWRAFTGVPSISELRWLGLVGGIATVVFLIAVFIRWLCCWRNLKRALFGLACFATLIALFYAEENWRGKHNWEKFKHEWEAKGEHFDFKDFIPPPVPDDQNFAMTPVVASCYEYILDKSGHKLAKSNTNVVNRLAFDMGDGHLKTNFFGYWTKGTLSNLKFLQAHYRELATKTNLFAVPPEPQSPAADVLLALGKYDATVEELRQAGELPQCRFPLNYEAEFCAEILLPHLAWMKISSQLLRLRALAELQNGQSDKALADVQLSLRLTEAIRTDPVLISHLVRMAMTEIILQPIYEGLANQHWTDTQLVTLDAELAKLDFLADYKFCMRCETGFQNSLVDYLRRHPEQIPKLIKMVGEGNNEGGHYDYPPLPVKIIFNMIPAGWFSQNQLRCARTMIESFIPLANTNQRTVSPAAARNAKTILSRETKRVTPYNILGKLMLPALDVIVTKYTREQISVDLARTAIALERYRLAHGEYPESLAALAPQFIAQVPHDVIGGQPLKYRREANGQFVLYSIGWNETDDGGVVIFKKNSASEVDIDQGDWVWRYPAK